MLNSFYAVAVDFRRQIFYDVLLTLESDPMAGLVSPPLLASTGVIPLSIVSVIPDIIKHCESSFYRTSAEKGTRRSKLTRSNFDLSLVPRPSPPRLPLLFIVTPPDADVIVRAETEIFFATNFWEASGAAKTICEALVELSRRVGERGGPKIVVKMSEYNLLLLLLYVELI